jgi:hypothetical protein
MSFAHHATTKLIGLSTLALGGALLLAGCAGSADADQSVDVTYTDAGETIDVTIDVPQLECSEFVGQMTYTADADDDRVNGRDVLASSPDADPSTESSESYTFSLALGDGLWFISTDTFEARETGLTLDGIEGIISPTTFGSDGAADYGTAVDTAATATGTLECTTTD